MHPAVFSVTITPEHKFASERTVDVMDIKDLIIYRRTIPARKATYVPFPESLNPKILEFLRERGIDQLYCHQAQMYELAGREERGDYHFDG